MWRYRNGICIISRAELGGGRSGRAARNRHVRGHQGADSRRAQVLVIGDGPIGQLAAQLANIAGASRVIMAGSWDEKLAIARECGIHETINYHNEDVIQRARELTEAVLRS